MVSSTHVGNNLGPRQLRRFRKRRDFGAAAGINSGCPQGARQPALLRPTNEAGRQDGPRQLRRFRKRRDFGAAAGIDVDSPQRAGWLAMPSGPSDLGSYGPQGSAPTLHRGLSRKARLPPPPKKPGHKKGLYLSLPYAVHAAYQGLVFHDSTNGQRQAYNADNRPK